MRESLKEREERDSTVEVKTGLSDYHNPDPKSDLIWQVVYRRLGAKSSEAQMRWNMLTA